MSDLYLKAAVQRNLIYCQENKTGGGTIESHAPKETVVAHLGFSSIQHWRQGDLGLANKAEGDSEQKPEIKHSSKGTYRANKALRPKSEVAQ